MPIRLGLIALLAWTGSVARADDEPPRVAGRVLDGEGRPAAGAGLAESWGANGLAEAQARERPGAALRAPNGDEGLCFDPAERTPDLAAPGRRLEPARRPVWGGRDLPSPVLLENGTETYERSGLEGRGVSNLLLIDLEGRLVAGGLDDLAKALDAPGGRGR